MSQVLYRKYRSQSFDELIGQEHITKLLKNAVKRNKLAHAYLFAGPRGTGKTSTARILAKAINCENAKKDGNPCNSCDACRAITNGVFLDLIEIDAASNRGIDQIRELKEKIEFSPTHAKYKIYIIDEVHMLTNEAFNALLKTLEEPPAHVIFMLATTEVHKLPPTILSRCQRYDFKLGTNAEIKNKLLDAAKNENVKLSEGALKLFVENARGSYRDALSLLDVVISGQKDSENPEEITEAEVRTVLGIPDATMVYYLLEKIIYKEGSAALELVEELDTKGVNLQQFIKHIIITLREIMVSKIRGDFDPTLYSFAQNLTVKEVVQLINIFVNAEKMIKSLAIPSLALEMVVAEVGVALPGDYHVEPPANGKRVDVKDENKKDEDKKAVSEKTRSKVLASENSTAKKTEKVIKGEKKVEGKKGTEEKPVKAESRNAISLDDISAKWKEITNGIKPANGHLFAFLEGAKLVSFEDDILTLEVPFEFHKERIECNRSREAILAIFESVYGTKFQYKCVVNQNIRSRYQVQPEDILVQTEPVTKPSHFEKGEDNYQDQKEKKPFRRGLGKEIEEIFAGL